MENYGTGRDNGHLQKVEAAQTWTTAAFYSNNLYHGFGSQSYVYVMGNESTWRWAYGEGVGGSNWSLETMPINLLNVDYTNYNWRLRVTGYYNTILTERILNFDKQTLMDYALSHGGGSNYGVGPVGPFNQGGDIKSIYIKKSLKNQAPTIALITADNQTLSEGQAIYTGNNDFTIRLTADDADPSDTLEYQIKLNGVIKKDWTPITRNTPVDYTFLKADYTKDRNSFTVTVRDSQGGQTAISGELHKVQGLPVNVVSQL